MLKDEVTTEKKDKCFITKEMKKDIKRLAIRRLSGTKRIFVTVFDITKVISDVYASICVVTQQISQALRGTQLLHFTYLNTSQENLNRQTAKLK